MLEIKALKNSDGRLLGLEASGHASDAPEGQSVVCASVSTLFEVLTTAAETLPDGAYVYNRSSEKTRWRVKVFPKELGRKDWRRFKNTLDACAKVAENIARNYPQHCGYVD